jgi:hypothetical protein
MIDDIESRLRRPETALNWAMADSWMIEGADEIAALRKELARLEAAVVAERERCAALCEESSVFLDTRDTTRGAVICAARIRCGWSATGLRKVHEAMEDEEARTALPGLEKMP